MTGEKTPGNELDASQAEELLESLHTRFRNNTHRHTGVEWEGVQKSLESNPQKLWSLNEMERTGGEADVVSKEKETGEYIFYDCSQESPVHRRNLCYDDSALKSRKVAKPDNSAVNMAIEMGVELLTEEQYRYLQTLGKFDSKTSSWLKTPESIRKLGGAIFGDRRFDHVFIYHNGASSYYSGRGFRCMLRV